MSSIISLDFTLTVSGQSAKTGKLTAAVDYTDAGYEDSNLTTLLQQIFAYNSSDTYTINDFNFNQDFIIGITAIIRKNLLKQGS
jgi:hypothetical protein